MKVRMIASIKRWGRAGDVVDIPEGDAKKLVRQGRAAVVRGGHAAAEKAVAPKPPETATGDDPGIAGTMFGGE